MFEVLLLHDNSMLHTSFHVAEAITKFGRTVLPIQLTVLTLHYPIIPFGHFKKPVRAAECHTPVETEERGQLDQAGICTLVPWW
jgi:hypothetical protein